jgi:FHS family L-fucose permease-like MFS transporter
MSLMYPTNFATGVKGLGKNAKLGASVLIMSMIGGALLSLLMGWLADRDWALIISPYTGEPTGQISAAMMVPLFSYCVIAWYAFAGSKLKNIQTNK